MGGSTRKKTEKPKASRNNIRAAMLEGIEKLYNRHSGHIQVVQEESEQNIVSVSFTVKIDCSEAEPTVVTKIKYSSVTTDSLTAKLEDVNQGTFQFVESTDGADDPEDDPDPDDVDDEVRVKVGDVSDDGKASAKEKKPKKKAKSKKKKGDTESGAAEDSGADTTETTTAAE